MLCKPACLKEGNGEGTWGPRPSSSSVATSGQLLGDAQGSLEYSSQITVLQKSPGAGKTVEYRPSCVARAAGSVDRVRRLVWPDLVDQHQPQQRERCCSQKQDSNSTIPKTGGSGGFTWLRMAVFQEVSHYRPERLQVPLRHGWSPLLDPTAFHAV